MENEEFLAEKGNGKEKEKKEINLKSKKRKNTLIFACSGLSNTGKLTMQAASALAFRSSGMYRAASAHKGIDAVEDAISEDFRILVLDGCMDHCATRKLDEAGLKADIYMTVTELGIEKTVPSDLKPEYVEKIIRAIKGV